VNPTARMITVDVARANFNKEKTRNPGEIKVKIETRSYFLLVWKTESQKKRNCKKYKRDLVEDKVANKKRARMAPP
jgi:hypothetical protein